MTDMTFAKAVEKKIGRAFDTDLLSEKEYYFHPTYRVSDLADYIRLISAISSINRESSYSETVIYRGMADQKYDLLPGLARYKDESPDMESSLINDFLTRRPDAFVGLSEFDTLAKMQHFGLPTRLLDFSLNPLVALYFACESDFKKDGRVLCHSTDLQNDSSKFVNAICTAAMRKMFDENLSVDEYLCNDELPLQRYMSEAYIYDGTTVVRPKYWNQRIANQAGVFMVFPNNLVDSYKSILSHEVEMGIDRAIKEYGRQSVDRKAVEEALNHEPLSYLTSEHGHYITDEYLRTLLNSYSNVDEDNSFWENAHHRFKMSCKLKALSSTKIQDSFCSIIVEGKNKKKIMKNLSYIGIGAEYIYPELEYTAKEIKRRFE